MNEKELAGKRCKPKDGRKLQGWAIEVISSSPYSAPEITLWWTVVNWDEDKADTRRWFPLKDLIFYEKGPVILKNE